MADALAKSEDVEALLGRSLTVEETTYASILLEMASATVRRYTRQTLSAVTGDIITFNGRVEDVELPERPIVSVTSVTLNGVAVASSAYELDHGVLSWVGGGWWPSNGSQQTIAVTYTHGFNPVPADIAGITAALVAERVMFAKANPSGLQSRTIGPFSETYGSARDRSVPMPTMGLSPDQMAALDPYRQPVRSVRVRSGTGR